MSIQERIDRFVQQEHKCVIAFTATFVYKRFPEYSLEEIAEALKSCPLLDYEYQIPCVDDECGHTAITVSRLEDIPEEFECTFCGREMYKEELAIKAYANMWLRFFFKSRRERTR